MNTPTLRKIIKDNKLNVKIAGCTNGSIKAIAFDVDDLNTLNTLLNKFGIKFQAEYIGTKFEKYQLRKVGA